MGIGPGGLGSDMEVFGTLASDRNAMMVESIDMIQQIWAGEPPWDIKGEFWTIKRSEEHTSELQSLMRISYAVFCLKKKKYTDSRSKSTPQRQHITIDKTYD